MTCTSNALVSAYPGVPPNYLSSSSADALISELRPTTLSSPALTHINIFLDELLESLLSASQSINPKDLRLRGVPSAFTGDKSTAQSTGLRALGRSAIGEAEIELRSWYESHSFARKANTGFPPGGKGRGLSSENVNSPFPLQQAVDLLRLKCVAFSVSRRPNRFDILDSCISSITAQKRREQRSGRLAKCGR